MSAIPLEIIGNIAIPEAIFEHRFYKEAHAVVKLLQKKRDNKQSNEPVVGTTNNKQVELYGWAKNVGKHADNTGHVYFMGLNKADSVVVVEGEDKEHSILFKQGDIARMDDFKKHFTFDDKERVCLFLGPFTEPDDQFAIEAFKRGLQRLKRNNSYYDTPRVGAGFRGVMSDECYAMTKDCSGVELMLLKDAKKQNRFIQTCSICDGLAVKVDHHFPYFMDGNRCKKHLKE